MKRFLLLPLLALAACAAPDDPASPSAALAEGASSTDETAVVSNELVRVGEAVPDGEALTPAALVSQSDELNGEAVLVEGDVEKVCQMAGCWLTFVTEANESIRINVPRDAEDNYLFTFPSDAPGRTARIAGTLTVEEESVETLRHYAEDEGASEEEIAAITAPRRTLAVEAAGVELASVTNA